VRIAVLIIGLVLSFGLFLQAFVIFGLSDAVNRTDTQQAGAVGVVMALLWLVSCGLVIPLPRVSMVLFALAGLLGFLAAGAYPDLAFWGGASEILAVFCYFGYRGKRSDQRIEAERDALLRQAVATQAVPRPPANEVAPLAAEPTVRCPSCLGDVPALGRYCPNCGLPQSASS
jgi:hypothetical protein